MERQRRGASPECQRRIMQRARRFPGAATSLRAVAVCVALKMIVERKLRYFVKWTIDWKFQVGTAWT
ncbi:unnamed protein product [Colias eurytheme]|nr:unnamed protein product [Colias eurytheme]